MITQQSTIYKAPTLYKMGGAQKIVIPDNLKFYLYLENISGRFCFSVSTSSWSKRLDFSYTYKVVIETPTFSGGQTLSIFKLNPDGTTNNGNINSKIRCAVPYGRYEIQSTNFQIPFGQTISASKIINSSDYSLYSNKLIEVIVGPDTTYFDNMQINWNYPNSINTTIKGANLILGTTYTWQTNYRIYGLVISKGDKEYCRFLPAFNTENNKYCFYDIYNGRFMYPDTDGQQIQAGPENPFIIP